MNLHEMLADRIQHEHAEAARRRRPTRERPRSARVLRRSFLRDRLVVTVTFGSARPAA